MKWAYLENLLTTVKMTNLPPTFGNPYTKSMEISDHTEKGLQGEAVSRPGGVVLLVALAYLTGADVLLDHHPVLWGMEICPQTMECLLDPFMRPIMYSPQVSRQEHGVG